VKSLRLMSISTIKLFAALSIPLWLVAQEQARKEPPSYIVTDLGTFGGIAGAANAVNNRGSVVGNAFFDPERTLSRAFLWQNGAATDLGTLGGPYSSAHFLNERGEVTGSAETSTPDPLGKNSCGSGLICLPFLWKDGLMTPLPTLGGNGFATGINNRGQVVGEVENTTPDPTCPSPSTIPEVKPVVWEKGEIQELPTIGGDPDGGVFAINDNGQAVGNTFDCASAVHAVLWNKGTPTDLGTLNGSVLLPSAINNKGQIVGIALSPDGLRAFLWQNGAATDLGTLPPDVNSLANGINNKGQIVGDSCDADFSCRAFFWQDGTMTELNTLVRSPNTPFLEEAFGINSHGQIAGRTTVQGTPFADAYLATPSPGEANRQHNDDNRVRENAAPTVTNMTSPKPRVVSPEDLRRVLRQRLGFQYRIPGLGIPKD
jgi:probable HAF family extracellular repeat protein